MTVREQIRRFIVKEFLFGQDNGLEDDLSLFDAGIIDSPRLLQVLAYLEETFEIELDDDEMRPENFDSIDNLTHFVGRKLSQTTV